MKRTGDIIAWLDYKGFGTSVGRMFGSGPLLERLDKLGRPACRPTLLPNSNRLIVFCLLVSLLAVVSEAQLCGRDAGGALCRDSLCCSTFGFCGTGSQYCGNGCQSNCNSSATDTSVICGFAANNTLCPEQYCCSQWGYCGTSEEFCGDKCQSGPCIKSSSSSGLKLWAKIVIVVAAAIATVAICAIVGAIICCFRRNRLAKQIRTVSEASHSMRDSSVDIVGPSADRSIGTIPTGMTYIFSDNQKVLGMKFSYDYLSAATNGFSKELGRGAFGVVYKGLLRDNTEVAVKSLLDNHRGLKDFEAEIKTLGNINHANLVALRGFCYEPNKPAYIVYEFAQNGSLDKWIFRTDKNPLALTWKLRMDIARGTARGLSYLHEDLQIGQAIIHLDIKPENILLDENFVPKVADFGMAKLIGEKRTLTIASGGTLGYMAPETYAGVATTKMDVYSFGMVLLELVCGRRNLNVNLLPEDEFYLPVWALRKVLVNEESEIVDPNLNGLFDPTEARTLIMAALLCLQRDPELRCDMSDVWKMIEGLITPPDLPDSLKADLDMVERILRRSSTSNSATTSTAGSIDRGSQGISSSMGTILSMSSNGSAPARSTSSSDSRSFDHETLSHRSMQPTMRPLLGTRVTLSQNSLPARMRSPRQQSPTHRSSIM